MPELSLPNGLSGEIQWSRRSVLLAGGLAGGLLLTGCGGPEKPVIQSENYDGAGSRGRIRTILERRAKALTEKNEEAYLADLDPANQDLINQEKLVFANLAQLEFAEIRYILTGILEQPDEEKGGAWYRPIARIAKLTADEGPGDIAPAESFLYRLIKKGDKDVIAEIVRVTMENREDLGIAGPRADAPWNTDKLKVQKVGDAVWLVGDESVTDLDEYAAITNRELATVKKLWGDREAFPGNVLFFTRDEQNVKKWFGIGEGTIKEALGYQIPQLGVGKTGQTFTGQFAASRILVNLGSIEAADSPPWRTIRHELTHAVTARASLAGYDDLLQPARWVVEGFARYAETIDQSARVAELRNQVASGVRAGKFRGTTPSSKTFYKEDVSFNYALGSTIFSVAEQLKGRDAATELFARLVKRVDSLDRSVIELPIFESISKDVLGMSSGAFRSRWNSYVRNGG